MLALLGADLVGMSTVLEAIKLAPWGASLRYIAGYKPCSRTISGPAAP